MISGVLDGCPEWQYSEHPDRERLLPGRVETFLRDLRLKVLLGSAVARDTRSTHRDFFADLTPAGFEYYAGHYRGEPFRCLERYCVGVQGDSRVGASPAVVLTEMARIAAAIDVGLTNLDGVHGDPTVTPLERLLRTVRFACNLFEVFLRIHPYADGNGHIARMLMIVLLVRYDYWPLGWTIEPRPKPPEYLASIVQYRNGVRAPLESYILRTVTKPELTN